MNEFIHQKRLKLLAVTSAEPSPLAPGTPTIGSVLPGYAAESWFAIIGPAGMPADLVAKLNAAISAAVQLPKSSRRFTSFGVVAKTTTPQKLSQMVAEEVARWTPGDPRQQHPHRLMPILGRPSPILRKAQPCPATPTTRT